MGVALVSFTPARLPSTPVESIAVNIVTDAGESRMTEGLPSAPKQETRKPLVERIGEPNQIDNPAAKIAPREVTASTDTPPSPPPEPKQVAKKKSEPTRDLIADALKKDDAKKTEQKQADTKIPTPPRRPAEAQPKPKFDPREMSALLDKRDPQRKAATGATISDAPSIGAPKAKAGQLTQNELDALRARLAQLWNPPAGAQNPQELVVTIRMKLKRDGTLAAPPMVTNSGQSALFMAARDSAIRAVFRGQPFDMLRSETYEVWQDIEITFDPRDMIRG